VFWVLIVDPIKCFCKSYNSHFLIMKLEFIKVIFFKTLEVFQTDLLGWVLCLSFKMFENEFQELAKYFISSLNRFHRLICRMMLWGGKVVIVPIGISYSTTNSTIHFCQIGKMTVLFKADKSAGLSLTEQFMRCTNSCSFMGISGWAMNYRNIFAAYEFKHCD